MLLPSSVIESIVRQPRGYKGKNDIAFRKQLVESLGGHGNVEVDKIGNIWLTVGQPNHVLMVAHTDTVDDPKTTAEKPITYDNLGIMSLNNSAIKANKIKSKPYCLGADDGAGIAFNYCMILEKIEATYLFTVGEERGCIGAQYIIDHTPKKLAPFTICMEVDRAGRSEIITHQSTGRCASDSFAKDLANKLNMGHKPSDMGVYTDNAYFNEYIQECVNIAAGYEHQHSLNETQDINYLDRLFTNFIKINFSGLNIDRDTTDIDCYGEFNSDISWEGYKFGGKVSTKERQIYRYIEENPEEIHSLLMEVGIDLTEYINME